MWELDYLTGVGALREDVAALVGELLSTDDPARAAGLTGLIESAVAPVSGGLADDTPAVVTAVVAGLPRTGAASRPEALLLLSQIVGSIEASGSQPAAEAGRLVEGALPMIGALIETGTEAEIAQGVDLMSMASTLSRPAAEQAVFHLSRIAATADGQIKASAEREIDEVRRGLADGRAD
ncbi:hypothetical protein GCM10023113_07310 [Cellulomonas oligotrophica]|uniref:Uncharacterized protein n=1 Tax=Cellulomonas oligotrophica TaxID=931536 RepID=A0ABQ4D544_9CELL|nr:hypothetical protein Col01nite_00050 [Cellulomonas oligotrophica]